MAGTPKLPITWVNTMSAPAKSDGSISGSVTPPSTRLIGRPRLWAASSRLRSIDFRPTNTATKAYT